MYATLIYLKIAFSYRTEVLKQFCSIFIHIALVIFCVLCICFSLVYICNIFLYTNLYTNLHNKLIRYSTCCSNIL